MFRSLYQQRNSTSTLSNMQSELQHVCISMQKMLIKIVIGEIRTCMMCSLNSETLELSRNKLITDPGEAFMIPEKAIDGRKHP